MLIINAYFPAASSCNGCFSPALDHMLTSTVLGDFTAHHSLCRTTDTNKRKPTGGFNQYFQLYSPKYRFSHKAPWECRSQFSRCIISISLSHCLVRMANTRDHELRPSAHPYRNTYNCHLSILLLCLDA